MRRDAIDPRIPAGDALLPAYRFTARAVKAAKPLAEAGGFDKATKTFRAMQLTDGAVSLHVVLDHITAAVEAGIVEERTWDTQLFATPQCLEWFINELESYDDAFRITDRWWQALAALAGVRDEEEFISCSEIASTLRARVEDNGIFLRDLPALRKHIEAQPTAMPVLFGPRRVVLDRNNRAASEDPSIVAEHASVRHSSWCVNPWFYVAKGMLCVREATEADFAAAAAAERKGKGKA